MNIIKRIAISFAATIFACGGASAAELIYSTHTPPNYSDNKNVAEPFFERITAATNGEQTFRIAAGGVLASGQATLAALKTGAIDSAILIYNYTPSDLPVLGLLGDLYSVDSRVAGPATTQTMLLDCPECLDEMKKHNVVVLLNVSSTAYNFLCSNSRIQSLADVAGKKVRAVGSFGPLAAHLGATPVNITVSEVFEALQRGQIDCAMNDPSTVHEMQLEMVKYVTDVPLGTFQSLGFITVNRDIWNGFTAEQKKAWINSASQGVADYAANFQARVSNVTGNAAERGIEIVQPDQDLVDAVNEFRANETPSLIERASSRGAKNPEALVEAFQANTAKWEKIVNDIGEGEWSQEQWDQYAKVVFDEIYSKVVID